MKEITPENEDPETLPPESGTQNTDGVQLSRLSSVLNGLEHGASVMRHHVQQAMGAVRAGTYKVDPVQLSRRIVGETLGSARKLAKIGQGSPESDNGSAPLPSVPF